MANATVTVLEADGSTQTDVVVLDVGRQAAAASKSTAMSTEDKAQLDAAVTALQLIDNTVLAEDAAHSSGDVGIMALAVRKDTSSTGIGANGDYVPLAVSSTGHLYTTIDSTQIAASVTSDQASNAAGQVVRIPPQEVHLGEVGGKTVVKTITMTADTAIMASADIIADTQQLDAAFRKTDGTGVLQSLTVFDPDDNAAFAFDVYVHSTSTSMGTENSGITITDANAAAGILGVISFATTDAKDLINGRMYHKSNIGLPVSAVSGTDDLYFSIVNGSGTPTFGGGSIPMRVGILQD